MSIFFATKIFIVGHRVIILKFIFIMIWHLKRLTYKFNIFAFNIECIVSNFSGSHYLCTLR